jgi:hypothetical protein
LSFVGNMLSPPLSVRFPNRELPRFRYLKVGISVVGSSEQVCDAKA